MAEESGVILRAVSEPEMPLMAPKMATFLSACVGVFAGLLLRNPLGLIIGFFGTQAVMIGLAQRDPDFVDVWLIKLSMRRGYKSVPFKPLKGRRYAP